MINSRRDGIAFHNSQTAPTDYQPVMNILSLNGNISIYRNPLMILTVLIVILLLMICTKQRYEWSPANDCNGMLNTVGKRFLCNSFENFCRILVCKRGVHNLVFLEMQPQKYRTQWNCVSTCNHRSTQQQMLRYTFHVIFSFFNTR